MTQSDFDVVGRVSCRVQIGKMSYGLIVWSSLCPGGRETGTRLSAWEHGERCARRQAVEDAARVGMQGSMQGGHVLPTNRGVYG